MDQREESNSSYELILIEMKKANIILSVIAILLMATPVIQQNASAQVTTDGKSSTVDGKVRFDKVVHDFGDVLESDGALKCEFTVENISSSPVAIVNVVSSCGCTDVTWTREPLAAGKKGKINATFSNDQGPYPFDKTLTVYISGLKKPVILRLRGTVHAKKLALSELYPVKFGNLGLKENGIKLGNMDQGSQRSDQVFIANLSSSPANVTFKDVSEGLKVSVSPNPIPAGSTATLTYTISSSRQRWGKNWFYATPVVGGKVQGSQPISFWAFTKEDFTGLTQEERTKGAQPVFETSNYNFNVVKEGKKIDATFNFTNRGKSDFKVYKVDADWDATTADPIATVKPGGKGTVTVHLDTKGMPKGEALVIVTLTTNSPLRPIVNLFLTGAIE